jgi:hypothetical protein
MFKALIRLLTVVLLVSLASCAPKNKFAPGKVSGVVRYKGEALKAGNIIFHTTDDKGRYQSSLGTDGKYEMVDVPTGTFEVTVETESLNPNKKVPVYGGGRGGKGGKGGSEQARMMGAPDPKLLAERFTAIPFKYADRKTSGLTATVSQGSQTINFDLTD